MSVVVYVYVCVGTLPSCGHSRVGCDTCVREERSRPNAGAGARRHYCPRPARPPRPAPRRSHPAHFR
ncbi:hypothetical protein JYU34_004825 [Plutella xylostella]|uniref:Secreted protein n=1 Tax=Plutella xylostella TaxID=51655 RepID=A0ABQ7QVD1_PLUXY|nr:hypothetical protein JYU34_004825 [Plutella xylostella]